MHYSRFLINLMSRVKHVSRASINIFTISGNPRSNEVVTVGVKRERERAEQGKRD